MLNRPAVVAVSMPNRSAAVAVTMEEDRALMRSAQRDPTTFTAIYRRYLERVYRYLRYRVGNEQDAQDLTTHTFMAALANLQSYRGEGTVSAWLLGIASHKLVDWQRKEPVTAPLAAALTVPAETELPEDLVFRQFERQGLEEALLLLAPERAEAITLRYFGELTNGEVAKLMGKQEAAVKMLIHRGLQDLRMRYRVPTERAEEGER